MTSAISTTRLIEACRSIEERNALVESHLSLVDIEVAAITKQREKLPQGYEYEDLQQEGSLGLIYAAETFDASAGAEFRTWAIICIQSKLRDIYRADKRPKIETVSLDHLGCNDVTGDEDITALFNDRFWVEAHLPQLPVQQATAIRSKFFDERTDAQTAHVMGISERRVGQLLQSGLIKLRRIAS